ncbi:MAG: CotH kinase family protein [Oscillospiraceae bacterium]|nr:CotH kinase family protein [Oscillospiraceae bacterium]
MRKIIIILFLCVGIICGAVIYGSAESLVLVTMPLPTFDDLAPRMQRTFDYVQKTGTTELSLSFSHNDFFYNETIFVTISSDSPDAEIYYTLDGSMPTINSDRFVHPLEITAEEDVKSVVVKAIVMDSEGQSRVFTHSYFVGTSINERFSTYVFSISTDPDDLYGYERGILVPGKLHDDFEALSLDEQSLIEWQYRANYSMRGHEWERFAYIEVFTQDGERIVAQNAGVRVHGGVSRRGQLKSLRLLARQDLEPGFGRFYYPFFNDYMDIHSQPILSHNTLILRNDGQDYYHARLRTPMASIIAHEAGFIAVSPQTAAAVFLNGEYYGFMWINIRGNEHFLKDLFDAPEAVFDIVDGGHHSIITDDKSIRNEFDQLLTFAEHGFDEEKLQYLHRVFDVDNMLLYYAIQTYIGNTDWPGSNIAIWRYKGYPHTGSLADELDGRWRFLMWDLDKAMYLDTRNAPDLEYIHRILDGRSTIFSALMQYREYAELFANYVCDMAFGHFALFNVERVIQDLDDKSLQEQKESLILYNRSFDKFLEVRGSISDFFERRPDYIIDELRELFGFTQMYRIYSDSSVKINTLNTNKGIYFVENSVPVYPVLKDNQVFDHWLVNGEKRYDESLLISFQDADSDGVVFVQCISHN